MSNKGDEKDSDVDSKDNDDEVDGEADGEVNLDDDGEVDLDDDGEINLDGSTAGSILHFNFRKKARSSAVWKFFDDNLPGKSEKLVCKKCKQEFSKGTSVSTLRRYLNSHSINIPKKQRTLHEYRNDPHPQIEQERRDKAMQKDQF
ncbi:9584_t:CDS:2 [Funneliformis caledonium]|uniref:9584_t:CDS:1 n=1 Tax=Funneliformis caledonium TaxID=1117310 RepID=A0A9N9B003_9GLOM|nr:9584_t:CDS:2 [Funneliformis caledonium]